MKKISAVFLALALVLSLASCGSSSANGARQGTAPVDEAKFEPVYSADEYLIYQNVFFNEMPDDYVGKSRTVKGIFTSVEDAFNDRTRYYVWGYYDQTKCCDWQWEIAASNLEGATLPKNGSLVEYTGTLMKGEAALDGYWLTGGSDFNVISEYGYDLADVDMTVMNGTLERVQLVNIQNYTDKFEGKTISMYGRIASLNSVQHPYYDNCFEQQFDSSDSLPAIGTEAIISGTYENGIISGASIAQTSQY